MNIIKYLGTQALKSVLECSQLSIMQQDHLGHTVSLHSYSINGAVPSELSKLPRFVLSLKFILSYFCWNLNRRCAS